MLIKVCAAASTVAIVAVASAAVWFMVTADTRAMTRQRDSLCVSSGAAQQVCRVRMELGKFDGRK
jgi:hypothetical protein